jgi:hypothetical protein
MTTFDEREKAFEKRFALEQDRIFLARAYAAKALGERAAKLLGLTGEEAGSYIQSVRALSASESNLAVVFDKVLRDLEGRGVKVGVEELHQVWEKARADAMTTGPS